MSLQDLYQEMVLDHCRHPKNYGSSQVSESHHSHTINNPLCGDVVTVGISVKDGKVSQASFVSDSCAICKASASLMTEAVKGYGVAQIPDLYKLVYLLFVKGENSVDTPELLGPFVAVSEWPSRIKCAMLPWNGLLKLALMAG